MKPVDTNSQLLSAPDVDLVVNCFERTYRKVLSPGFLRAITEQNLYSFRHVTLLLNNINRPEEARVMAEARLAAGEITQFFFVAEHLDQALAKVGLTRAKLGPLPFYSDWALVALTVPGSDWIVHWDADVHMEQPMDWIMPSLQLIAHNPAIATANPCWKQADTRREERYRVGSFILSYGFTDQVFLLRRSEFARPIYRFWVPISMRFPVSHVGPYFEQWVDAYMRVHSRLRATYLPATFVHATEEGSAYPKARILRLKDTLRHLFVAVIRRLPLRHPYLTD
jgi:hypothetical protein